MPTELLLELKIIKFTAAKIAFASMVVRPAP